jgi:hypothetical protein
MTDPNPAQRLDWWTTQHEAAQTSDERYGKHHRPTYARVGAGFVAACTCDSGCERVTDRLVHPTWDTALDAAKTSLELAEHGPGQETA